MNYSDILSLAQKNTNNFQLQNKFQRNNAKKSGPDDQAIKNFLAKQQRQNEEKSRKEKCERERLLAKRSQNSKEAKAARMMSRRTKDNDFSRIVVTKDMEQEQEKVDQILKKKAIYDPTERMKARIKIQEEMERDPKARKKKALAEPSLEDTIRDDIVRKQKEIKALNGLQSKKELVQNPKVSKKIDVQRKAKVAPPPSFDQLLKIASQKSSNKPSLEDEINEVLVKNKKDTRPKTQKEKDQLKEETMYANKSFKKVKGEQPKAQERSQAVERNKITSNTAIKSTTTINNSHRLKEKSIPKSMPSKVRDLSLNYPKGPVLSNSQKNSLSNRKPVNEREIPVQQQRQIVQRGISNPVNNRPVNNQIRNQKQVPSTSRQQNSASVNKSLPTSSTKNPNLPNSGLKRNSKKPPPPRSYPEYVPTKKSEIPAYKPTKKSDLQRMNYGVSKGHKNSQMSIEKNDYLDYQPTPKNRSLKRSYSPSPPLRPKLPPIGQMYRRAEYIPEPIEDEYDEDDEEWDDFIDDGPVEGNMPDDKPEEELFSVLKNQYGYDKEKYRNMPIEECEEARFAQVMKEEARSARLGAKEDAEEERKLEEAKKQKLKRKTFASK